jgi:hypothetical protein
MQVKKKIGRRAETKQTAKALVKEKKFLSVIADLNGVGKRVWKKDAQEFIAKLRGNDRF